MERSDKKVDSKSSGPIDPSVRPIGIPLCRMFPIRWRQVFRATISRFLGSKLHTSIVVGDLCLMAFSSWDIYGILSIPAVRTGMILLLVYEGLYFSFDLLYNLLYYQFYFYDMNEKNLVIRRGVLCKTEITLPLNRITDVYLEQDFGAWMLGLYDLHLSSPTKTSGQFAHMIGIDRHGAFTMREQLLRSIHHSNKRSKLKPLLTTA